MNLPDSAARPSAMQDPRLQAAAGVLLTALWPALSAGDAERLRAALPELADCLAKAPQGLVSGRVEAVTVRLGGTRAVARARVADCLASLNLERPEAVALWQQLLAFVQQRAGTQLRRALERAARRQSLPVVPAGAASRGDTAS